jgi:hypothetical protein
MWTSVFMLVTSEVSSWLDIHEESLSGSSMMPVLMELQAGDQSSTGVTVILSPAAWNCGNWTH